MVGEVRAFDIEETRMRLLGMGWRAAVTYRDAGRDTSPHYSELYRCLALCTPGRSSGGSIPACCAVRLRRFCCRYLSPPEGPTREPQ
jgi:hypothetical protein